MEYGLIGEKLGHSYSKIIQEKLLDNYIYELHPLAKEEVETFMKEKAFKAINVTIPYKQTVIPFLDEMDDAARKIGAVNTVVNKNGVLKGYNTDYFGFKYMLEHHNINITNKKVLVMGNGGASKAIQAVVSDKKAKQMLIVDIIKSEKVISIEDVYEHHKDVDVIINTTPLGMYPKVEGCCVDFTKFTNIEAVLDVVYNPFATEFALQAQNLGIKAITGLEMLVAQAKYALEYFKDISIDDSEIDRIYKEILMTTTNIIVRNCEKGKTCASYFNKEFIDISNSTSIVDVSREIGVLNNKVIYYPSSCNNIEVLHNLKRNGIFVDEDDYIEMYKEKLDTL